MPARTKKGDLVFLWSTALMALGSVAASLMELIVFLGIGWDYALFDCLLALTVFSTVGLLAGIYFLSVGDRRANVVIVLSSLYVPMAFIALTVEGFTPPVGWWPLLLLGLMEIIFGLSRLRAKPRADHDVQA